MTTVDPASPKKPPWTGKKKPRVMLLGAGNRPHVEEEAERLSHLLPQFAEVVHTDLEWEADLSAIEADFAIVLGGDGSILGAARSMGYKQIPIVGVNMGKLGFLAAFTPDHVVDQLAALCAGECQIIEHMMLRCRVLKDDEVIAERIGLNEMALLGGPPFQIRTIDLYVDTQLATSYSCDGLIISTPVGSTAHNLSAGGPILRADLRAFVVSPISPHTLTMRSVVDTGDRCFEMHLRGSDRTMSVVVDGRVLSPITSDHRVRVDQAQPRFKLVATHDYNYYRTLREKLGWGGQIDHGR
ncbi:MULTISPECIES: NAD(+)/NADH kinase [Pirellulaceae]|nr:MULTISPECIES: NAD(+)/NADH kinase [Pirellulaceae]